MNQSANRTELRLEQNGQRGPCLALVAGDYREWRPAPVLQPAVRCLWTNTLRPTGRPLLVVPDGCIDLIWTGNALVVAGPDTGPVIETVSPGATIVGVRFRPGAATAWLRSTAHQIANRRVPLADLWGRRAHRLEEQLWRSATPDHAAGVLERSLLTEMPDAGPSDRRVRDLRAALTAHARTEAVGPRDLAADLGLSERTVRRRCHELLGYGPKTFARILRFQRFIARAQRAERVSLAALASLCGYADQAHLSREVRRLSGLTPHAIVGQLAPAAHR